MIIKTKQHDPIGQIMELKCSLPISSTLTLAHQKYSASDLAVDDISSLMQHTIYN